MKEARLLMLYYRSSPYRVDAQLSAQRGPQKEPLTNEPLESRLINKVDASVWTYTVGLGVFKLHSCILEPIFTIKR